MIIITGGAGFIGSNLVAALEQRGMGPLVICDRLGSDDRWRNIAKRQIHDLITPEALLPWLDQHRNSVEAILHMGAVSATTERDVDLIVASNLRLSIDLWDWCARTGTRFIYASSAATYGDGSQGFDDDSSPAGLARLLPLNPYGWSKHVFDRRIAQILQTGGHTPPQWVGLKFFNVFGPNEYHKGDMRSVVTKLWPGVRKGDAAQLFASDRPEYPDGGQMRDFVGVDSCVDVMLWLMDNPGVSGLFNLGTGQARSWNDLISALYRAAGIEPRIDYVPMPNHLRGRYQYFTEARMDRLRAAGYKRPFPSLEQTVESFVRGFLSQDDPYR